MQKIQVWYNNLKFRKKLILWFLLLALLPSMLLGAFSLRNSVKSGEEQYKRDIASDLRRAYEQVEKERREIMLQAIDLSSSARMVEILANTGHETQYMDTNFQVEKMLFDQKVTSVVDGAYVLANGTCYTNRMGRECEAFLLKNEAKYRDRLANGENSFWTEPIEADGAYMLSFIRRIKDYRTKTELGMLAVNYNEERISRLTADIVRLADNVLVADQNGVVLSSWDKRLIGKKVDALFGLSVPDAGESAACQTVDGKRILLLCYAPGPSGWTYIGITDYAEVIAASGPVIATALIMPLLAVSLCAILALVVSRNMTKPIAKLTKIMDEVESGDLTPRFIPLYSDEIGRLTQSFNNMTKRLRISLAKTIEMQTQHQKDRYDALSAQINSHFFYNTLSSIIWLANSGKTEEIIKIVEALARLLRITMSESKEFISVREEVEHVRSYLEIQEGRYKGGFKYVIDVAVDLLELEMIKTVLQPLVENAIYHGVRDLDKEGVIRIVGREEEEDIVFEIWDNGNAADQKTFDKINYNLKNGLPIEGDHGIGLKNVYDRICFHFGEGYGVSLCRAAGGTLCIVRMRQRKEKPDVQDIGV